MYCTCRCLHRTTQRVPRRLSVPICCSRCSVCCLEWSTWKYPSNKRHEYSWKTNVILLCEGTWPDVLTVPVFWWPAENTAELGENGGWQLYSECVSWVSGQNWIKNHILLEICTRPLERGLSARLYSCKRNFVFNWQKCKKRYCLTWSERTF